MDFGDATVLGAGLQFASRPGGLAAQLALLGRTSLSHYVLHLAVAYVGRELVVAEVVHDQKRPARLDHAVEFGDSR